MVPKPGDPYALYEPHDCFRDCWDDRRRRWSRKAREARRCQRQDLPPVEQHGQVRHFRWHFGRRPDPNLDPSHWSLPVLTNPFHEPWWRTPPDDWQDGCAASWTRSVFALSLVPYLRRRTDDGARVQNFRLDARECRITRAAVLEYEEHEERRISYQRRLIARQVQAQRAGP